MSIKLEIHPSSSSLDLLGPPDPSSAYSLSGYISISLTSPHSLFERRRAVRIILRSLVITFEGQAELVTHEAGYTSVRLCTISKELVSKTTVELSNDGHEDEEEPCSWHVMFDLQIPGWLPASDLYGDSRQGFSGTQYNLFATMKFSNVEEGFTAHAKRREITLQRFALPPRSSESASRNTTYYSVTPNEQATRPEDNPCLIPADIVSKIELLASVPARVNVGEEKIPFVLSVRTSGLPDSQAAKLRVSQLSLDLQQVERYSSTASAYATRFPLPPEKNQPPNKPLREAHPVHTLYDIGLLAKPFPFVLEDSHSLLPESKRVDIQLNSADNTRKCAKGLHPTKWFTMESQVPFMRSLSPRKDDALLWTGTPRLRESSQSPFFSVAHVLRVIITLSYEGTDDGKSCLTSFLAFSLPLNFVRTRSSHPRSPSPERSDASAFLPSTRLPPSQPYHVPDLPAYSQLFYPNGDLRHDDSIPLPLYTPSPRSLLT
ncbi:hypothetical protein F5148DRAFT_1287458 [Russula earlei]|uniref:Uncharacterized protein n=1 Tax=Russula earlei TaxID=71964 RepID=A0ACC0U2X6_9AGAM|nr:hypothetical protein F5148DRAFT_1287458 [Russula earlei]